MLASLSRPGRPVPPWGRPGLPRLGRIPPTVMPTAPGLITFHGDSNLVGRWRTTPVAAGPNCILQWGRLAIRVKAKQNNVIRRTRDRDRLSRLLPSFSDLRGVIVFLLLPVRIRGEVNRRECTAAPRACMCGCMTPSPLRVALCGRRGKWEWGAAGPGAFAAFAGQVIS